MNNPDGCCIQMGDPVETTSLVHVELVAMGIKLVAMDVGLVTMDVGLVALDVELVAMDVVALLFGL